jgi:hypothetical protein
MFHQGLQIVLRNEALFLDNQSLLKVENLEKFSSDFNQLTFRQSTMQGCVGALDGVVFKVIKPDHPKQKLFYNRKGFFAISYQAVVDSNMNFTFVSEPFIGSTHDMHAFRMTCLYHSIYRNKIFGQKFWIAADSAYELSNQVQTPYSRPAEGKSLSRKQKAYNEKLSSLRVRVEIAFGILKQKFPILLNVIEVSDTNVCNQMIMSCFLLHNFCRSFNLRNGISVTDEDGELVQEPSQQYEAETENSGKSTRRTRLTDELFAQGYRYSPS